MDVVKDMKNRQQKTDSKSTAEQPKEKLGSDKDTEAVKTMSLEDKIDLERRGAYVEPQTRDLLRRLLEDGVNVEIIPSYNPGLGFEYHSTGSTLNIAETDKLSKATLENLAQLGILKKTFFDSVSICPSCQSTILTLHNRCPKCKSHNVDKTSLTEHIPCGYIDQRDKYINDQCPKCGQPLVEGQFRNMGRWYVCQECGEKFENPEYDLVCRNCNKNFTIKEAQVVDIPKFSLNLQRRKEIRQNVESLESIQQLLTDLGFSVEIPGLVIGQKSGMQHHFSLIAKKLIDGQERVIALDHAVSETEVATSPLILYLYKTSEVAVDVPIFVAIPQLNETAKKITQGHDILLIEGSIAEPEVMARIKSEIERRLEAKKPATASVSDKGEEDKTQKKSFLDKFMGVKKKKVAP
jgi:predicted RNA-binding Zn-ribbon protein involved in translation (DUF1610 family)